MRYYIILVLMILTSCKEADKKNETKKEVITRKVKNKNDNKRIITEKVNVKSLDVKRKFVENFYITYHKIIDSLHKKDPEYSYGESEYSMLLNEVSKDIFQKHFSKKMYSWVLRESYEKYLPKYQIKNLKVKKVKRNLYEVNFIDLDDQNNDKNKQVYIKVDSIKSGFKIFDFTNKNGVFSVLKHKKKFNISDFGHPFEYNEYVLLLSDEIPKLITEEFTYDLSTEVKNDTLVLNYVRTTEGEEYIGVKQIVKIWRFSKNKYYAKSPIIESNKVVEFIKLDYY